MSGKLSITAGIKYCVCVWILFKSLKKIIFSVKSYFVSEIYVKLHSISMTEIILDKQAHGTFSTRVEFFAKSESEM